MVSTENELSERKAIIAFGAIGGVGSWVISWLLGQPALPDPKWISLIACIFMGAIFGFLFTTFIVGFEKPSERKQIAVSLLCGLLWMSLSGYLPFLLSTISSILDVQNSSNRIKVTATEILQNPQTTTVAFNNLSIDTSNLIKKSKNMDNSKVKSTVTSTVTEAIQALKDKSNTNPKEAAKAIFKIGFTAVQNDDYDLANTAAKSLRQIPGIDSRTIKSMYGELPEGFDTGTNSNGYKPKDVLTPAVHTPLLKSNKYN